MDLPTRRLGEKGPKVPVLGFGAWPIGGGLLTGGYAASSTFSADDERSDFPDFQGERFARHIDRAARLAGIAESRGITLVQLAIAWTLARPIVGCTLVGAMTPEQAREHAGGGGHELSDQELAAIEVSVGQRPFRLQPRRCARGLQSMSAKSSAGSSSTRDVMGEVSPRRSRSSPSS
jgi:aryl-alcohol dehydrogenase-like predicted oxidoreductase